MNRSTLILTAVITIVVTMVITLLSVTHGGFASGESEAGSAFIGQKVTTPILIHLVTAGAAALLGPVILVRRKGNKVHKLLGRLWAVLMIVTAISSAFIYSPGTGVGGTGYSFIHIFTIWTLINVPLGVWAARTKRIRIHRGMMAGLYVGLLIAGGFTFIPGRLLGHLVFGW